MSEKYKLALLNTASKLDALTDSAGEISDYARKMADEQDDSASLWLFSKIDSLSSSQDKKIKIVLAELYNSVLLFFGCQEAARITARSENFADDEKTLEELQSELEQYVGLKTVKQKVSNLIAFHTVQKLRKKENLKNAKSTLHMAFIGNPGTGKTSVARIIGRMYKKIGLLSKGHFTEVSRTDVLHETFTTT